MPELYPVASAPKTESFIAVDDLHKIYICEYGNPQGIPVIICHGGPGAGSKPDHAAFLNPDKYRIILFDQRGSGKSTPTGSLLNNTTGHLIADMEIIRTKLAIDKWVVFGGSWGSTLGLLYAEKFPRHVSALVLRGIFLGRAQDCDVFYRENSPAALCNPQEWQDYKTKIDALTGRVKLPLNVGHVDKIYALLTYDDASVKQEAADILGAWEKKIAYFTPSTRVRTEDVTQVYDSVSPALIEVVYTKNNCFIEENQILDNVASLKEIPVYIIQGKVDLMCPQYQAFELAQALRKVGCEVSYYECLAGHAGPEVDIVNRMITATDELASKLS